MNTYVILALDTRRKKQDGTYPIVLRVTHFQKLIQIQTGFAVKETDWNIESRSIKASYKGTESVTRLNNQLQKKKTQAIDTISKLDERKALDSLSASQLKEILDRKPERTSFNAYAQTLIKSLKEENRIGNARSYSEAVAAVKKFNGGRDITFVELNLKFLQDWEHSHIKKGKSYNGLAAYLRAVRAIYNFAIKAKLVDKELYPFAEYQIKTVKTRKRAISADSIRAIEEKQLANKHPLFHTRNLFLFSFYCRGMPFADLAELQLSNIINGRIFYERKKTGTIYDIKIHGQIQTILNYYVIGKNKNDYIFPIIKRITAEEQYKDIEWARHRFNDKLKLLATSCGIQEKLTSYVSRHSFATLAKNMGIDTAAISDMLGHGDIKTTQVYLDSLSSNTLDDLHERIIDKI